jgi:uncharacterized membrane protein
VALGLKIAEEKGITDFFEEHASILIISDVETARSLLSTLVAGGISMLVFSFSMVMLLLSQAAANYSPRVLPNLISERKHQVILGSFLATILFNIITIVGIDPQGKDYQLPGFSVLIGILSAIVALIAFIYFIHTISTSIQINNILKNIYTLSRKRLENLISKQTEHSSFPDTSEWSLIRTQRSGAIQNISNSYLREISLQENCKLEVIALKGDYLLTDTPAIKTEKKLSEELQLELLKSFNYQEQELVSDNYILGFKQITEIGIKAMSPGINDPGTAINSIDYLADLFALRMQKNDETYILNDDDEALIKLKTVDFDQLIYTVLAPFRQYCKHDYIVMYKLFAMLSALHSKSAHHDSFKDDIKDQAKLLLHDAKEGISNPNDLEMLQKIYHQITSA